MVDVSSSVNSACFDVKSVGFVQHRWLNFNGRPASVRDELVIGARQRNQSNRSCVNWGRVPDGSLATSFPPETAFRFTRPYIIQINFVSPRLIVGDKCLVQCFPAGWARSLANRSCLLLITVALLNSGCGSQTGPVRYRVHGTVDHKARPLVNGTISFLPASGHKGPAANGVIQNGVYDIPADEGPTAGPHQVLINLVPDKININVRPKGSDGGPMRMKWEFSAEVAEDKTNEDFLLSD